VHGNEKCGTYAIFRMIDDIRSGRVKIGKGRVTFVPICNPQAYAKNVRFVERNLNRFLVPMAEPDCYEARLGNILCPVLADCDVLLDLHSYRDGTKPFIFVESATSERARTFASTLGPETLLTGWAAAYAASNEDRAKPEKHPDESTGTTEYARRFGALSVTMECGDHNDPQSAERAYAAIQNALRVTGLVEGTVLSNPARMVVMRRVFYKTDAGTLARDWRHLDAVKAGDVLATRASGEALCAPANGFMILPDKQSPVGQEWFYFGEAVD
jgi:predicted deacylase